MTLRSLDTIHLATAASISRQLGALITYDSDLQAEPSVGLEPTTPSLPSRRRRLQLMRVCVFMLQIADFVFSGAADREGFHAG